MDITLTENLKAFRKDKGNTQEELATFLGISVQAVSKWERGEGYPDITLLHRIAAFYNKSVDDLLGVGEIAKQERIKQIMETSMSFSTEGKTADNVIFMRDALKEFPNEHDIILHLMYKLSFDENVDLGRDYRNEIIEMGERLLRESTDDETRYGVIQLLGYTYNDLGDVEKATNYAIKLPSYATTRNSVLCYIKKGDELLHHTQSNLEQLVDDIFHTILWMISAKPYTADQKIRAYKKALNFYSLLYDDGNYGFYHCRLMEIYHGMSKLYSEIGDTENTMNCLSLLVDNAIISDTMISTKYTAFLVDNIEYNIKNTSKNFKESNCEQTINNMADQRFDFIRDDERFIKLKAQLDHILSKTNQETDKSVS